MAKKNPPASMGSERREMLEDMLARCRVAMEYCFSLAPRHTYSGMRMEAYEATQRLMKTYLMLSNALEAAPREFVHRIVVEHSPAPPLGLSAPANAAPTPSKNRKNN